VRHWLLVLVLLAAGCGAHTPTPLPVDPTLRWTEVTTDCEGLALSGVTYNLYVVPGPGPVPTVASADELPCGVVQIIDHTLVSPINQAPLSTTSYQVLLADGEHTAAVEALNSVGSASAASNQKTFTVRSRPGVPQSFVVGP